MNILLFGATGLTGQEILKQAIENGHKVIAIVRDPSTIDFEYSDLKIRKGNILEIKSFEDALIDADVVISAVGTGTS